jgi:hypothetical protein
MRVSAGFSSTEDHTIRSIQPAYYCRAVSIIIIMSGASYTFVRIPADTSAPIEEITADKSGGLTNDSLVGYAKKYFGGTGGFCNIVAVTVPMATNGHLACSMYTAMDADNSVNNARASALLVACGGTATTVRGDAFFGRVHDDENADIWERQDFTLADADPSAAWCRQARASGRAPSSSLQNMLQSSMGSGTSHSSNKPPPAIISDPSLNPNAVSTYGMNGGEAVQESWGGQWTQTGEEVEVRIAIDHDVTAKQCQVKFGRTKLKVTIANVVRCEGILFDPIDVDESTYTIQTTEEEKTTKTKAITNDGTTTTKQPQRQQKELCVHLAKAQSGVTWPVLLNTTTH